ncbi:MAG: glycine zipper 2TM domain-containing protein [Candidatus Marsarchaeota archaeon]|nr:glycine zipper 2TM domain-containing protein [Candidatus Marsarchaeota archaeon]
MERSKSRISDNRNMLRTEGESGKGDSRIRKSVAAGSAVLGAALLAGCVSSGWPGPVSYTSNEMMTIQRTLFGTVTSVQRVNIKPSQNGGFWGSIDSNAGTIVGGSVGALVGSQIGGNPIVNSIGAVGGAVAGAVAGEALTQNMNTIRGYAISVKIKGSSEVVTVTQPAQISFTIGEPVQIDLNGSRARVEPTAQNQ